jgi:hypothetical protein
MLGNLTSTSGQHLCQYERSRCTSVIAHRRLNRGIRREILLLRRRLTFPSVLAINNFLSFLNQGNSSHFTDTKFRLREIQWFHGFIFSFVIVTYQ